MLQVIAPNEIVVRLVYSPYNYNFKTKRLKSNFISFRPQKITGEFEMSCNRLFFEKSIDHLRSLGIFSAKKMNKEIFAGVASILAKMVFDSSTLGLRFSPDFSHPLNNYSHTDMIMLDKSFIEADGKATNAEFLHSKTSL